MSSSKSSTYVPSFPTNHKNPPIAGNRSPKNLDNQILENQAALGLFIASQDKHMIDYLKGYLVALYWCKGWEPVEALRIVNMVIDRLESEQS